MTRDDLTRALDAFALFYRQYPKQESYVAGIRHRVGLLFTLNASEVEILLSGDKAALRAVSDTGLEVAQSALRSLSHFTASLEAAPTLREADHALYWEARRRRTNAARAANVEKREKATAGLAERFPVGRACLVHAFGYWYGGVVVGHAARGGKVRVSYTTGTGKTREKLVDGSLIAPA